MQNENQMIITGANLRFSGFCGISSFRDWFRICEIWSVLYYNFYTLLHIYEFSYTFDTVLYQYLKTGTSDRCLICIVQRLRFSGFILYPPFNFSFIVPLSRNLRPGIVLKTSFKTRVSRLGLGSCVNMNICYEIFSLFLFSIFFESLKSKCTQMLRPQKGNSGVLYSFKFRAQSALLIYILKR